MIGNDIVDLQLAAVESNWQRRGYLHKIFTVEEQAMVAAAAIPARMVWLLWSAKEAVYKIINRATTQRFYAPQKIVVSPEILADKFATGTVQYNGELFSFRSIITPAYIHTTAAVGGLSLAEVCTCTGMYNGTDYTQMLHRANFTGQNRYLVKDNQGIPAIRHTQPEIVVPLSISHHGRYAGACTTAVPVTA